MREAGSRHGPLVIRARNTGRSQHGPLAIRAARHTGRSPYGPLVIRAARDTGRDPTGSRPVAIPSFPTVGDPPRGRRSTPLSHPHKSRT